MSNLKEQYGESLPQTTWRDPICDRRGFLLKSGRLAACGSLLGLLVACEKWNLGLFGYEVDTASCIGCEDCVIVCQNVGYDAIRLAERSSYRIDIETCGCCSDCVAVCEDDAISISPYHYEIEFPNCVGCGKCIDVCVEEGNAITWLVDYYHVRGSCMYSHPQSCGAPCITACQAAGYDAISINSNSGRAQIDTELCQNCGACYYACRDNANDSINTAKVNPIEQETCTHCNDCFDVCEHEAVLRTEPEDFTNPVIDEEKCSLCGKCIPACPDEAISHQLFKANIVQSDCYACGNCYDSCKYDAIREI